MNRSTLVIGGLVALAVLLGLASWLLVGGRKDSSTTSQEATIPEGPMALNPVSVITKTGTTEGADNRTLNVLFSDFELRGSNHEVKTAVFSTTWHVKLQPGERVAVATVDVKGFMSSSAAQPQPAAQPAAASPPPPPPATGASGTAQPAATPAPPRRQSRWRAKALRRFMFRLPARRHRRSGGIRTAKAPIASKPKRPCSAIRRTNCATAAKFR